MLPNLLLISDSNQYPNLCLDDPNGHERNLKHPLFSNYHPHFWERKGTKYQNPQPNFFEEKIKKNLTQSTPLKQPPQIPLSKSGRKGNTSTPTPPNVL
jgi:hypothetical protein